MSEEKWQKGDIGTSNPDGNLSVLDIWMVVGINEARLQIQRYSETESNFAGEISWIDSTFARKLTDLEINAFTWPYAEWRKKGL